MNIAEHKLQIFRQIDQLPEESLIVLEKIIAQLQSWVAESGNSTYTAGYITSIINSNRLCLATILATTTKYEDLKHGYLCNLE